MMRIPVFNIIIMLILTTFSNTSSAQSHPGPVGLNHLALYVQDLEVSTKFYREIIGLQQIPEPFKDGRHSWFSLGRSGELHIISGADASMEHNKNNHLCFSMKSLDDFMELLSENEIPYTNWPGDAQAPTIRPDGVKQIYFQDPDGYWIEINDDIGE